MEQKKFFNLPKLPFDYKALMPYMSEEQLKIHHDKHHQAYVNGANAIFDKLDKARKENADLDMKSTLKELSFHIGGHLLHSTFWDNMAPPGKGGGKPGGAIADMLMKQCVDRPLIMQIEKHNVNVYPAFRLLMVLDLWEHAYYLDYKNDRAKFVEGFWNVVNWDYVNKVLKLVK